MGDRLPESSDTKLLFSLPACTLHLRCSAVSRILEWPHPGHLIPSALGGASWVFSFFI